LDTKKSIPLISNKKLKTKKQNNKKIPKQVQCSECSLVWCFRCSAPWHENMTCKQFVKGDKLLLKWINQKNEEQWNARKCPKCSSLIQRAGGIFFFNNFFL
jgi:E3 ubiquitin-protein ligase RNF217